MATRVRNTSPVDVALVVASLRILGGQSVQAQRNLAGFAGDREFRLRLVPIDPVPPRPFNRLLAIKFVRTAVTQLLYWPQLFRELRRVDLVHAYSASYTSFLLAPLPAVIVAKLLGKPVLLNYHSGEAPDHLRRSRLARAVLRRWVDLNVVPSEFLREVFASHGIAATVVTNTIDLDRFPFRVRDPLRPHLLSTRSFEPLYDVECTLRAFARIQARHPGATLTLIGGGSQDEALRRCAEQLNLRHVTFVGRVPPETIHRYYDAADIYLQTPRIDNLPLSVIEAFACGLPVVSTPVGGVPSMLGGGAHGYLAAGNDPAEVARQVEAVLADPNEARRRALSARHSCAAFTWSRVRVAWVDAYRLLLPNVGAAASSIDAAPLAEPARPEARG